MIGNLEKDVSRLENELNAVKLKYEEMANEVEELRETRESLEVEV